MVDTLLYSVAPRIQDGTTYASIITPTRIFIWTSSALRRGHLVIDPVVEMPYHCLLPILLRSSYRHNAVNDDALIDLLESTVSGHSLFVTILPSFHPRSLWSSTHHLILRAAPLTWLPMPKAGMITSTSRADDRPFRTTATAVLSNGTPGTLAPMQASSSTFLGAVAVANPAALTYRPKPVSNASGTLLPALPARIVFCCFSSPLRSEEEPVATHPGR